MTRTFVSRSQPTPCRMRRGGRRVISKGYFNCPISGLPPFAVPLDQATERHLHNSYTAINDEKRDGELIKPLACFGLSYAVFV